MPDALRIPLPSEIGGEIAADPHSNSTASIRSGAATGEGTSASSGAVNHSGTTGRNDAPTTPHAPVRTGKSTKAGSSEASEPERRSIPTMSIGLVLEVLRREFPDVAVSKLRFLENEGLISPARNEKGYRRYSQDDINRLRYILTAQRDHYLPLKKIKAHLDAMDAGKIRPVTGVMPATAPEVTERLTYSQVCAQARVDESYFTKLAISGLVHPDTEGRYAPDAVVIARIASQLGEYGFDQRHLRALSRGAQQQADLIIQSARPLAAAPVDGREASKERARELTSLFLNLHTKLVAQALDQELD